jgi:hypothetical protein
MTMIDPSTVPKMATEVIAEKMKLVKNICAPCQSRDLFDCIGVYTQPTSLGYRPVLDLACLDEKRNRYGQCCPPMC